VLKYERQCCGRRGLVAEKGSGRNVESADGGLGVSPLVPTALDGAAMSVCSLGLLLALAALTSLSRAASLTGRHLLAWALVVLFVPFVGPVSWFCFRLRGKRQRVRYLDDDA
jgi:hypothetical protein